MADRTNTASRRCSFCGRSENEVEILIPAAKQGAAICSDCIATCANFLQDFSVEEQPNAQPQNDLPDLQTLPKPAELKAILDQYVIGQDAAKRVLSVAVYNH